MCTCVCYGSGSFAMLHWQSFLVLSALISVISLKAPSININKHVHVPVCTHYTAMKQTLWLAHVSGIGCSAPVPWGWSLANCVLFRRVQSELGFQRCKIFGVGGAITRMDIYEYLMSLNIPMMNFYGGFCVHYVQCMCKWMWSECKAISVSLSTVYVFCML